MNLVKFHLRILLVFFLSHCFFFVDTITRDQFIKDNNEFIVFGGKIFALGFFSPVALGIDMLASEPWVECLNCVYTSCKSPDDPGVGDYSFEMNLVGFAQIFLYKDLAPLWQSGTWTGHSWSGIPEMMTKNFLFNDFFVSTGDEVSFSSDVRNTSFISRRSFRVHMFPRIRTQVTGSTVYKRWNRGCVRKHDISLCGNGEGFVKFQHVKVSDTSAAHVDMSMGPAHRTPRVRIQLQHLCSRPLGRGSSTLCHSQRTRGARVRPACSAAREGLRSSRVNSPRGLARHHGPIQVQLAPKALHNRPRGPVRAARPVAPVGLSEQHRAARPAAPMSLSESHLMQDPWGPTKVHSAAPIQDPRGLSDFPSSMAIQAHSLGNLHPFDHGIQGKEYAFISFSIQGDPHLFHMERSSSKKEGIIDSILLPSLDRLGQSWPSVIDREIGCLTWHGDLLGARTYTNTGQDLYIRVDENELARYTKKSLPQNKEVLAFVVVSSAVAFLILVAFFHCLVRRRRRGLFRPGPKRPAFIEKKVHKGDEISSSEGTNSVNGATVTMIQAR
ncbi:hypothetical protein HRI_005133300 [Hibiscus trionum]|uniref:Uncharacterized protein n=1 Tax=Hibiscus trionum TaxID=183268 RepID=A0A9W7JHJ1_HIBTR|nr:hypothetical protein HRI_005133300 [Hibiscus trionum]